MSYVSWLWYSLMGRRLNGAARRSRWRGIAPTASNRICKARFYDAVGSEKLPTKALRLPIWFHTTSNPGPS